MRPVASFCAVIYARSIQHLTRGSSAIIFAIRTSSTAPFIAAYARRTFSAGEEYSSGTSSSTPKTTATSSATTAARSSSPPTASPLISSRCTWSELSHATNVRKCSPPNLVSRGILAPSTRAERERRLASYTRVSAVSIRRPT